MVQLVPMSESEFQAYLAVAIPTYAQEHVNAGRWHPSEALREAQKEYHELLPEGLATKDHYLFSLEDAEAGSKVGLIWFEVMKRGPSQVAFLYEILIFDQFRRNGYGLQAMRALEEHAKRLDIDRIRLHVFAHNQAARALYEKLGYQVTNLGMSKRLSA